MTNNHLLLCMVSGMLVAEIPSSVIPRVGETMYVDGDEDSSLLFGKNWVVLHVNYAYMHHKDDKSYPHIDTLNQVTLTLIESKNVGNDGILRDFPQNQNPVV